jgi:hypothetical protein
LSNLQRGVDIYHTHRDVKQIPALKAARRVKFIARSARLLLLLRTVPSLNQRLAGLATDMDIAD